MASLTLTPPHPDPPDSPGSPTSSTADDVLQPSDPRWARPAYVVLLATTALLYLWDLSASGYANSFYAAAAQAGSESWSAFFFGASDAAGSITVDKTPLALWPMALSIRVFGLSSWSVLVPQALMGVVTVALLHRVVRRSTGSHAAAMLAGAVLSLTPVAALMFRFDNPDAALTVLLTGSAAATLRGVHESHLPTGRPARWLVLGGALVGLGFLAKMLQAFLVLPVLAGVYLALAGVPVLRRLGHLALAFTAMLVAGGWWIAVVELVPAASRPYVGGSQTNSILELTLGYNGLGRLTGDETGSVGGGWGWGETGLLRLFGSEIGGQVAWLLPAALVLGTAGLWCARRHGPVRASLALWLGWLLVTGLTFSLMAGIFHAYYTVALAPAIAALVGTGAWALWRAHGPLRSRGTWAPAAVLGATSVVTAVWAFVLLGRSADFLAWLRWVVLAVGVLAGLGLAARPLLTRTITAGIAAAAVLAALAGPAAYAMDTATTAHTGSIPSAGPTVAGGQGMPGGAPGGGAGARPAGGTPGGFPGAPPGVTAGRAPTGAPTGTGPGVGMGGLLEATTPSAELVSTLTQDAGSYTWIAAAVGANTAAGYQLATGESGASVMPIGGFNGSDPSPTLAQFQQLVADGDVHWFIAGGGAGAGGGGGSSSGTAGEITSWVESSFTAATVDGTTLYDLSGGAS